MDQSQYVDKEKEAGLRKALKTHYELMQDKTFQHKVMLVKDLDSNIAQQRDFLKHLATIIGIFIALSPFLYEVINKNLVSIIFFALGTLTLVVGILLSSLCLNVILDKHRQEVTKAIGNLDRIMETNLTTLRKLLTKNRWTVEDIREYDAHLSKKKETEKKTDSLIYATEYVLSFFLVGIFLLLCSMFVPTITEYNVPVVYLIISVVTVVILIFKLPFWANEKLLKTFGIIKDSNL